MPVRFERSTLKADKEGKYHEIALKGDTATLTLTREVIHNDDLSLSGEKGSGLYFDFRDEEGGRYRILLSPSFLRQLKRNLDLITR